jgi:trans-aconitate 3-methyltransferase
VILDYHKATMGLCETALDLGCGPGTVTKDLATRFDRVFGSDISEKMYNSAPSLPNVKVGWVMP